MIAAERELDSKKGKGATAFGCEKHRLKRAAGSDHIILQVKPKRAVGVQSDEEQNRPRRGEKHDRAFVSSRIQIEGHTHDRPGKKKYPFVVLASRFCGTEPDAALAPQRVVEAQGARKGGGSGDRHVAAAEGGSRLHGHNPDEADEDHLGAQEGTGDTRERKHNPSRGGEGGHQSRTDVVTSRDVLGILLPVRYILRRARQISGPRRFSQGLAILRMCEA